MPRLAPLLIVALAAAACSPTVSGEAAAVSGAGTSTTSTSPTTNSTEASPPPTAPTTRPFPASTTTTTTEPAYTVRGSVVTADGAGLANATLNAGPATVVAGWDGAFVLRNVPAGDVTVTRPGWADTTFPVSGDEAVLEVTMEPFVARAVRVSREVASEPTAYTALLRLIDGTHVNALVFDTKDESGAVLYETAVAEAREFGAVDAVYDVAAYLAAADRRRLYAITRIVSFEDPIRVKADPSSKLAGAWVDASNEANWDYLLDLAVEACDLGFDEIQFDYVRFPAGKTAASLGGTFSEADRLAAVTAFLSRARELLHPMGCAVAADVFGIVMTSSTDEGIGQRPEEISAVVDVISPMLYPSHYSEGTLGFADPNDHPAPVIAWALDTGLPRVAGTATVRPWLQAFYYNGTQVQAEIGEAEERGIGWMLWNAPGNYSESWLPGGEDE